jgi:ferrous iron transport protein A
VYVQDRGRERRERMMPLTLAQTGEEQIIRKVGGSQELKQHLGDMGFVPGGSVTVISAIGGNVIVRIKESRIAISKEMAQKIMI